MLVCPPVSAVLVIGFVEALRMETVGLVMRWTTSHFDVVEDEAITWAQLKLTARSQSDWEIGQGETGLASWCCRCSTGWPSGCGSSVRKTNHSPNDIGQCVVTTHVD